MGACSESKSFIFTAAAYELLLLKLCSSVKEEKGREGKGREREGGGRYQKKKVLKCFYKQAQRERKQKENEHNKRTRTKLMCKFRKSMRKTGLINLFGPCGPQKTKESSL